MAVNGPVLIIDDNVEEQQKVKQAFTELGIRNSVEMFGSAEQALAYLESTADKPFIILTKTVLPGKSGLDFLDSIYKSEFLKQKSIPFIFFGDIDYPEVVRAAFDRRVQGYFLKCKSFPLLKLTLMSITEYWYRSAHPNIN